MYSSYEEVLKKNVYRPRCAGFLNRMKLIKKKVKSLFVLLLTLLTKKKAHLVIIKTTKMYAGPSKGFVDMDIGQVLCTEEMNEKQKLFKQNAKQKKFLRENASYSTCRYIS